MSGFKQFIMRGNVVDLAVGVVIGAAFGNVINSLVKDIITPFISAIIKAPDFSTLAFTLNGTKINYGSFLNNIISFLIIALAIYLFVVLPLNRLMERIKRGETVEPETKKCPECLSDVPRLAKRCKYCTAIFNNQY